MTATAAARISTTVCTESRAREPPRSSVGRSSHLRSLQHAILLPRQFKPRDLPEVGVPPDWKAIECEDSAASDVVGMFPLSFPQLANLLRGRRVDVRRFPISPFEFAVPPALSEWQLLEPSLEPIVLRHVRALPGCFDQVVRVATRAGESYRPIAIFSATPNPPRLVSSNTSETPPTPSASLNRRYRSSPRMWTKRVAPYSTPPMTTKPV